MRLNGPDNEPLGIVPLQEALHMAGERDVDLVEIAPNATPPVCRLIDYGRFRYQEQKKAAEAKASIKDIRETLRTKGAEIKEGTRDLLIKQLERLESALKQAEAAAEESVGEQPDEQSSEA